MPATKKRHHRKMAHAHGADSDDIVVRKITGKDLSATEELSARLTTLVEMLHEKGIISKNEYSRLVVMRLHEISKASAFEEMDEEL